MAVLKSIVQGDKSFEVPKVYTASEVNSQVLELDNTCIQAGKITGTYDDNRTLSLTASFSRFQETPTIIFNLAVPSSSDFTLYNSVLSSVSATSAVFRVSNNNAEFTNTTVTVHYIAIGTSNGTYGTSTTPTVINQVKCDCEPISSAAIESITR